MKILDKKLGKIVKICEIKKQGLNIVGIGYGGQRFILDTFETREELDRAFNNIAHDMRFDYIRS